MSRPQLPPLTGVRIVPIAVATDIGQQCGVAETVGIAADWVPGSQIEFVLDVS